MHIPLYSEKLFSDDLADSDANFSVGLACHAPRDSDNEVSEPVVKNSFSQPDPCTVIMIFHFTC
jgi:hypothetical protein